jgi:hypothetical protein
VLSALLEFSARANEAVALAVANAPDFGRPPADEAGATATRVQEP